MKVIRVVVNGALGRVGREVTNGIVQTPGLKLVGAVEKEVTQRYLPLAGVSWLVPFSSNLVSLLESYHPDVVVDFTNAEVSMAAARITLNSKINMVIGTTGLSEENLAEIEQLCQSNKVGAVVAPNFSLGAALLMHLSNTAAKFFDHAEIIEMHHEKKIDAPSGTAIATAKAMVKAHGKSFIYPRAELESVSNTRGGQIDGIAIHSVRMPGFMAAQEVIFSQPGETLHLRHEAISRECYLPGVVLAIREVVKQKELIFGLHTLLTL